jgi:hypothetical protein
MYVVAPSPAAIFAALAPTIPPPMITTVAGATPGTPARRIPRPSIGFSRNFAPSCTAIRPATSLIGMRRGRDRSSASTVSYAMQIDWI